MKIIYITNLYTGNQGFAIIENLLPKDRTMLGFGMNDNATIVDFINFKYSTLDIEKTMVKGLKTGKLYHIHRNQNQFYENNDPENKIKHNPYSNNTLTLDKVGESSFSWTFSPYKKYNKEKGSAMNGMNVSEQSNNFAWTLWVK